VYFLNTLERTESIGNLRGASGRQRPVHGTHGAILLHKVRRVTVRNVTVRQGKASVSPTFVCVGPV